MRECPPRRVRQARAHAGAPRPPWRRGMRPPFGLHRQIFWSLVGSTVFASLMTLLFVVFSGFGGRALSPAGLAGFTAALLALLWAASWRLSWRLVTPLNRLVDVVQRLGNGELSARAGFAPNARDEVSRVANAIDTMADRLQQQVNDERQLLAAVSHELRTPLARVRVLTALARERDSHAAADIDQIDREVAEIDDLVAKVLARSRLTFGTMTTRGVDVRAAVREALDRGGLPASLLRESTGARGSEAHEGSEALVSADPTLLHRAIANVLENAIRHGGGVDAVEVAVEQHEVCVDVLDRGPGFQPGDAGRRFDAFGPDTTGGRGSGLGLGLHLVARIIEAHHGRVWAENRLGGGARVGFALPVTGSGLDGQVGRNGRERQEGAS